MNIILSDINPDTISREENPHGPLRVLLLEDNVFDAELIEREMSKAGINALVVRVDTRKEYLQLIQQTQFDIVLADYLLPEFSGLEALKLLHKLTTDIPFLLVTGSQSEEVAVECLHQGADDYILKDNLKRLPGAVSNALKKKHADIRRRDAEQQLQLANKQLHALSDHLQSIREEERKRIAREIHDELGQVLTGLKLDLSWLYSKMEQTQFPQSKELQDHIIEMTQFIDSAIYTVRRIATELRPRILDDVGLIPALDWVTEEFRQQTGVSCSFTRSVDELSLDQQRATAIFRIVQESLTNITRHANASRVTINLEVHDSRLILEISDDGKGITEDDVSNARSLGLIGMRERAHLLRGTLTVQKREEGGTVVRVEIPIA